MTGENEPREGIAERKCDHPVREFDEQKGQSFDARSRQEGELLRVDAQSAEAHFCGSEGELERRFEFCERRNARRHLQKARQDALPDPRKGREKREEHLFEAEEEGDERPHREDGTHRPEEKFGEGLPVPHGKGRGRSAFFVPSEAGQEKRGESHSHKMR